MKTFKTLVLAVLFCVMTPSAFSQTLADFFNNKAEVTWLGIDYSHVRLIGEFTQFKDAGPLDPAEIRDRYFPAWNSLVLNEPDKYDIKGMFKLTKMDINVDLVKKLNAETSVQNMKAYEAPGYTCEDMQKFVRNYEPGITNGLGIVFVAEALNKTIDMSSYFIIVLDMKSKEILLCKKMNGKAGGIGLRNFWAGSLYNIVKDVKKDEYRKWRSESLK